MRGLIRVRVGVSVRPHFERIDMSRSTHDEPLAVSVSDAARLLGFKDSRAVYNLIRTGQLKAKKASRTYLVVYRSLKAFLGEAE